MLKKVFLFAIVLTSLAWIGYVAWDISSNKYNYTPENLFDEKDEEILVILRPEEIDFNQLDKFTTSPAFEILQQLNDSLYNSGFFSLKRDHFLLIKEDNWNRSVISSVFEGQRIEFSGIEEFSFSHYAGRFHKTKLYVWDKKFDAGKHQTPDRFVYDSKASAAILRFGPKNVVDSRSDIYFKENGNVRYITKDQTIKQGKKISDERIFSGYVSKDFSSYHFYERDYYAAQDEVFAKGPMFKWILNGFVELDYDGQKILISDYVGGQDPLLILNEIDPSKDTSVFNQPLTKDFPSAGGKYTLKYLEDIVVISESNALCNRFIADYKLGKTIALNNKVRYTVYGQLPRAVSERYISPDGSVAKSMYHGKIMEARTGFVSTGSTAKVSSSSIAMSCGFDIKDFATFNKNGSLIALGKEGQIKCFESQKEKWTKDLKSKTIGGIQLIDLHGTGEQFVLVNTMDEIHLWNLYGDYISGFPVKLEEEATNQVKFYRWKGSSYFLIANATNEVLHFDAKGRELNIIKTGITVNRQIDVWASQRKLFAGFANNNHFVMYHMGRKRIHREFNIPTTALPVKVPNQLLHYGLEGGKLVKYDQKGSRFDFLALNRAKMHGVISQKGNPVIIAQALNAIKLINSEGIQFGNIQLPFNEVEDVSITSTNSGETIIAVIDGLANNVYVFDTNGQKRYKEPFEGQLKVEIKSTETENRITTVVDQFVIQYIEAGN